MPRKSKFFVMTAAVMVFIIAAVSAYLLLRPPVLRLYDADTGRTYASWPIEEGLTFSVEFVHSVNKSPVRDIFVLQDGEIYADATIYSAFGAGVQTEIEEGQTLTFNEDGTMTVSGFHLHFPKVSYIVGTVSDHVLRINDEIISLRDLCGRNAAVVFQVR
ncbi:MAG: DUF1850 domain-containing protein [Ruminococcaceae bacterium]|nr:DUF1850 domain-containing protein [Oscillospiraceae bacterium]